MKGNQYYIYRMFVHFRCIPEAEKGSIAPLQLNDNITQLQVRSMFSQPFYQTILQINKNSPKDREILK